MTREEKKSLANLLWKVRKLLETMSMSDTLQKESDGGYTHNAAVALNQAYSLRDDLAKAEADGKLKCDGTWM